MDRTARWLTICGSLLLFISVCQAGPAGAGDEIEISAPEYRYVRATAAQILARFPRDKFYYLGVGRSPTVLIAYLQLIDARLAGSLPFTKGKWARDLDQMSAAEREQLKRHLRRFLPAAAELGGRRILLIDHTESGLGLRRIRHYIEGLFGDEYPVESVALVFRQHDHEYLNEMTDHKLVYDDEGQIERFASERYDAFAAYGEAIVAYELDKLKDVKANPKYALVMEAVKRARKRYSACESDLTR